MFCPHCGAELYPGANHCIQCGKAVNQAQMRNAGSGPKSEFVLSTQATVKPKKKSALGIILLGIGIFIFLLGFIGMMGDSGKENQSSSPRTTTTQQAAVATPRPIATPTPTPTPSKTQIQTDAPDVTYNNLIRNPEKYKGQFFCKKVRISQILESWGKTYYFGYTEDPELEGWYLGDEYAFVDGREFDTTKIVKDDIVTVYGKYAGTEDFQRALTRTSEEIPMVEILYVEIEGLD